MSHNGHPVTPTSRSNASRRYDLVLWGATGFTGELVAEYIARHYGSQRSQKLRWAIGGRSRGKLEKVREALAGIDPGAAGLPILLGDSGDRASLDAIARDARVVVSTVGPYALYGAELVAACVEAGTDYCDLTGEPQFVRRMIDAHHARAQATGARIVHCCGFDSIPSDLGTLMVQARMREQHGCAAAEVRCLHSSNGFSFSGGTVASLLQITKEATADRGVRRILADPYSLDPQHERKSGQRSQRDQLGVRWDADLARWSGPFALAATNSRVVRRTNALLAYAYGRDFRYQEAMSTRAGAQGWLQAAAMSVGNAGFFAGAAVPPLRWLLEKTVLPGPGEGPSKEERERGRFTARFVGVSEARSGAPPAKVFGTVRGMQDPGYGETAKMLTEAAVCLALDADATAPGGGVLTPGACMGMRLVERLRAAGMTFETSEHR
jgi:short subunit dehydrogenase-like uncharacterized protein